MPAATLISTQDFGELPPPYGLFPEWAAQAAILMKVDLYLPVPGDDWAEWARALVDAPGLRGLALPPPTEGEGWEDWAGKVRLAFPGA